MLNKKLLSKDLHSIEELPNYKILISSTKTISFFSTLSIDLYEKYSIPASFIALNKHEENYLNKLCAVVNDFNVLRLLT